jgi:hypothetical protein
MFVEFNPTASAAAGVSVHDLVDELGGLELDVRVIEERQYCLLPITSELLKTELVDGKWYTNLYCARLVRHRGSG